MRPRPDVFEWALLKVGAGLLAVMRGLSEIVWAHRVRRSAQKPQRPSRAYGGLHV